MVSRELAILQGLVIIYSIRFYHGPITSNIQGDRLVGAMSMIKARAPVSGGNFGVWGGMFSTYDCAIKGWRQKEDAWNAILAGFMTGGSLAARSELELYASLWPRS
jgi:hypothetical protein